MGVGGLLMEIVTRPQPRAEPELEKAAAIAAIVLAAGRSTRMGGPNKLLAEIGGKPLVRIAAEQALASTRPPGDRRDRPSGATRSKPRSQASTCSSCTIRDFAEGLSTSVKAGIAAVPDDADGAVVCLGDMPQVSATLIDRLIAAFDPERGASDRGADHRRQARQSGGLWSRRFFPELMALDGDVGARHLIAQHAEAVAEVPLTDIAALVDVDTPEALVRVRAELEGA